MDSTTFKRPWALYMNHDCQGESDGGDIGFLPHLVIQLDSVAPGLWGFT